MNYLSDIFGLVTKHDPVTENGGLFFAHYLVLKLMLGIQITPYDHHIFLSKMDNANVSYGLYLRSKNHQNRTVSHDEITGMIVASYILKTLHKGFIIETLVSNYGNYPATGENKYYNPANLYAWGTLTSKKWAFLAAPLYTINLLISSNTEKGNTSSKLIYLTELFVMKEESLYVKMLYKYYTWRMTQMYGVNWVKELYAIYFASEGADHPLIEMSRRL